MRSRTRNRPLLLTVLSLISALALHGEDYLIGYRLTTQNSQLFHEQLSVSKSMSPCMGEKLSSITVTHNLHDSLKTTLLQHEEAFLTLATQQSLHLQSHQNIRSQAHSSSETLTLSTRCYAVEFNEETATITLLQ
ncbi:MAG: hypothetical protein Q7T91_05835 [Sulfuricurvum sp.]|nr:hypothetical protein [Sulfuricurvum sp.]